MEHSIAELRPLRPVHSVYNALSAVAVAMQDDVSIKTSASPIVEHSTFPDCPAQVFNKLLVASAMRSQSCATAMYTSFFV
jgi:hypothetical protein